MWYNNLEFRALIAACDMFWNKFPDAYGSQLRVCTLSSRFKDCSSISEIKHLSSVSAKPVNEIFKYIFSERTRDEVINIGKAGEEFSQDDSYFPYMRELRLSKRSPYSSTVNENLHNWIHMFCALMGSERSYNARLVSDNGLAIMMNLALFAANAFKKYTTPKIVFGDETNAEEAKAIHAMAENEDGEPPEIDPHSALGVYQFMVNNGNEVPLDISNDFAQFIGGLPAPRDRTISQFLRRNITIRRAP